MLTAILICCGLFIVQDGALAKKPAKPVNTPLELTEADRTFIELREAARKNDATRAQQLAASLPNYIMGDYVEYFKI